MNFFPKGFTSTTNDVARYFKPVKNTTAKVRIVSEAPVAGYVRWTTDNKPVRWDKDSTEPFLGDAQSLHTWREGDKAKKFFAMAVWNYDAQALQVWEVTQRTIYDALESLTEDPDFGHPNNYDLKITRRGEGLETTYSVQAVHSKFPLDAQQAMQETPVNLDALFKGEDPFANA